MTAATAARVDLAAAADEDLIARVADGDRDALGELYRRHRGVVRGYVLGRIARADDADDVVQDSFLRAAGQAGQYQAEDGYRVPVWLCWQAGAQLRDYGRGTVHPYLAAARSAREQARRPVTETAEQREATPLSEPVQAALDKLTPGERRAIQLRYLDGLNPEQAAEIVGVRKRSFHRRVSYGRRKLAAELADLAPPSRSELVDMPRREAYTRALAATGDHVPAATAWLHKHGIRVSDDTLYRHRHNPRAGDTLPAERVQPVRSVRQPARPAYTPPEYLADLASALDRARAVGVDYRARFGHLPTRRDVMNAAGVSESTATRALRPRKVEPPTQHTETLADQPAPGATSIPADAGDGPHRTGGRAVDAGQGGSPRHRVRVASQAARSAPTGTVAAHRPVRARATEARAVDTYATTDRVDDRDRGRGRGPGDGELDRARATVDQAAGASSEWPEHATGRGDGSARVGDEKPAADEEEWAAADVAIARARAAVDELAAHRAEQNRRRAEKARAEQLNNWHADGQRDARTRTDAEGSYLS